MNTPENHNPIPQALLDEALRLCGTPVFIALENEFRRNCADFARAFQCGARRVSLAYSYKTNNLKAFCSIAREAGYAAEVVSAAELDMAVALGIAGKDIYYNGPFKPEASLRTAVARGAAVHADSLGELASLAPLARALGKTARVALRITPAASGGAGTVWDKFGFSAQDGEFAEALACVAGSAHLHLEGLHIHTGTNLTDPAAYRQAAAQLVALALEAERTTGDPLAYLDIGGGFSADSGAVPLAVHPEEWSPLPVAETASRVARVLDEADPGRKWTLVAEPGRVVAESAMLLLCRVVVVKKRRNRRQIVLDAGTNILPTAYYTRHPLSFPGKPPPPNGEPADFHGPLCTQHDVLALETHAPPLAPGDLVLVHGAGAYAWAFSSQFTGPRPAIVMARSSGGTSLVRKPEPDTILWQYDQ